MVKKYSLPNNILDSLVEGLVVAVRGFGVVFGFVEGAVELRGPS
jgi:hypothetical protein